MSNFNQHVASDKRKWALVFTALFLVIVFLVVMVWSNFFTEWNKYCWGFLGGHKYDDNGICIRCGAEKPVEDQSDENAAIRGGAILSSSDNDSCIKLTFAPLAASEGVSPVEAANSWTITVTKIEPSNADYPQFDWTIRWKNADSAWANGKSVTDYGTITANSDNGMSATFLNLKDFGEQIEIVCSLREKPEIYKVVTVDYVQRITAFTFKMPDVSSETTSFTYEVESSAYTVASNIELSFGNMTLTSSFMNRLYDVIDEDEGFKSKLHSVSFDACDFFVDVPVLLSSTAGNTLTMAYNKAYVDSTYDSRNVVILHGNVFAGMFYILCDSSDGNDYQDIYMELDSDNSYFSKWFNKAVHDCSGTHATFDLTYKATFNGNTYSTGSTTVEVRFDGSALRVPVEDFNLSADHIYA